MPFETLPHEIVSKIIHDTFMDHGEAAGFSLVFVSKTTYAVYVRSKPLLLRKFIEKRVKQLQVEDGIFNTKKGFIQSAKPEELRHIQFLARFRASLSRATTETAFLNALPSPAKLARVNRMTFIKETTGTCAVALVCEFVLSKMIMGSQGYDDWCFSLYDNATFDLTHMQILYGQLYMKVRRYFLHGLGDTFLSVHGNILQFEYQDGQLIDSQVKQ